MVCNNINNNGYMNICLNAGHAADHNERAWNISSHAGPVPIGTFTLIELYRRISLGVIFASKKSRAMCPSGLTFKAEGSNPSSHLEFFVREKIRRSEDLPAHV